MQIGVCGVRAKVNTPITVQLRGRGRQPEEKNLGDAGNFGLYCVVTRHEGDPIMFIKKAENKHWYVFKSRE